jgi:predicted nuclease of restriction endonuclease-like RecB superfamily
MPDFELPYLVERDHGWLRALIDEHLSYCGRRQREWRERLGEPFEPHAPQKKLRHVARVVERLGGDRVRARVPPPKIREAVFQAAAREANSAVALSEAATALGLVPEEAAECLFADLSGERRLAPLPPWVTPAALALETNQSMASSLLARSRQLVIAAEGGTRALVQYAKWHGLIANARRLPSRDGIELEVSGPLALFRHTGVYGRALAGILPRVAACETFSIRAMCRVGPGDRYARFTVTNLDPVGQNREIEEFAGRVDARFAEDFVALGSDWELSREPEPLAVGELLVFPDFELIHRADSRRRVQLEIIGYWTREYVERRQAETLLICLNERLACGAEAATFESPRVLPFRKRIDAARVLEIVERIDAASRRNREAICDETTTSIPGGRGGRSLL